MISAVLNQKDIPVCNTTTVCFKIGCQHELSHKRVVHKACNVKAGTTSKVAHALTAKSLISSSSHRKQQRSKYVSMRISIFGLGYVGTVSAGARPRRT